MQVRYAMQIRKSSGKEQVSTKISQSRRNRSILEEHDAKGGGGRALQLHCHVVRPPSSPSGASSSPFTFIPIEVQDFSSLRRWFQDLYWGLEWVFLFLREDIIEGLKEGNFQSIGFLIVKILTGDLGKRFLVFARKVSCCAGRVHARGCDLT